MINPTNPQHLKRLFAALEASRRVLRPHREKRMEYLAEYVGMHYGEKGTRDRVPVNYLHMATALYVRLMASRNPAVLVKTDFLSFRPIGKNLQLVTQRAIEKMKLKDAVEEMVTEAMFGMGIVKVGLRRTPNGPKADVGSNYCVPVDFDDWVHDTRAKHHHQCEFEGDRYSLTVGDLLADPRVERGVIDELPTMSQHNLDDKGEERSESLGRGSSSTDEEGLDERIELWDLFLPREQLIVTLESQSGQVVKIVENDSLDIGPYHRLGYNKVSGNLMPLPPSALIMDLHQLANTLFTKNMRQASLFKKVIVAPPEALKDGELFRDSVDGEYMISSHADRVGEKSFHGADPNVMAMYLEARGEANRFGGNLDALGGLGPQSETLGQDQLIAGAANERLQGMDEKKNEVVTGIVRHLAFNLYTDPVTSYRIPKRIKGTDMEIAITFTPQQRTGDFLDFNFDIQAFSMAQRGPTQQLQALRSLVNEFIGPMAGMIEAQGGKINAEMIVKEAADNLLIRNLDTLVEFPGDAPPQGPDMMDGATKPAMTTRKYVRVNRPGATAQGRDRAMSNALMGIKTNRSQSDAAARSVS